MIRSTASAIGRRLKLYIDSHDITVAELARHAGVKSSFIHDIISGKSTNPSTVKLASVAAALDLDLAALAGKPGALRKPRLGKLTADDACVSIPHVAVVDGTVVSSKESADPCRFRRSWINNDLGASPADLRLLRILGDGMEPTLRHNDLVLIDTARRNPSPPGIFVVFDGLGLVPRRLEYTPHKTPLIRVISDNPRYATYECSTGQAIVVGRIAWAGRAL